MAEKYILKWMQEDIEGNMIELIKSFSTEKERFEFEQRSKRSADSIHKPWWTISKYMEEY
jgi:hypothetical protein